MIPSQGEDAEAHTTEDDEFDWTLSGGTSKGYKWADFDIGDSQEKEIETASLIPEKREEGEANTAEDYESDWTLSCGSSKGYKWADFDINDSQGNEKKTTSSIPSQREEGEANTVEDKWADSAKEEAAGWHTPDKWWTSNWWASPQGWGYTTAANYGGQHWWSSPHESKYAGQKPTWSRKTWRKKITDYGKGGSGGGPGAL